MAQTSDIDEFVPGEDALQGRIFAASVFLSLLLHASVLVVAFLGFEVGGDFDADIEWMQSFESLEAIGHGADDRWAQLDDLDEQLEDEPEEVEEPEEPEPEAEPEQPEPEPEPEPERTEAEPDAEIAQADPDAPEPQEREPVEPTREKTAFDGELPGIDRSGPNKLPSMESYGPGNAIFSALLRLDRLRGTPFEESVRRVLEVVPDYRIALEGTTIDPVQDLDSLFMASAAPQYLQQTFLAVRHRLDEDTMRSRLDRRFGSPMQWTTYRGVQVRDLVPPDARYSDPRRIVLARDGLAIVAREEWLEQLTDPVPHDSELLKGVAKDKRRGTLIDGLEQIERVAERDDTLLLMSAQGAMVILPGIGRVRFETGKVSIRDASAPTLEIDMKLGDAKSASRFAESCPNLKARMIKGVPFLARGLVRNLVDRLTCTADDNYVSVYGRYRVEELQQVLSFAVGFIPRPAALQGLPAPPAPPPESVSDSWRPDAGAASESEAPDAGSSDPSRAPDVSPSAEASEDTGDSAPE